MRLLDDQMLHSAYDHANFLAYAHLTAPDLLKRHYPESGEHGRTRVMTYI